MAPLREAAHESTPTELVESVTIIDDSTTGQPSETIRETADGTRADLLVIHRATYRVQFYAGDARLRYLLSWGLLPHPPLCVFHPPLDPRGSCG